MWSQQGPAAGCIFKAWSWSSVPALLEPSLDFGACNRDLLFQPQSPSVQTQFEAGLRVCSLWRKEEGKSEMVLGWVLALGAGPRPFGWFSACSAGSVVSPALRSGAKEPQLKQHSDVQGFLCVVFFRCWSKMWFYSLLTVPLRLCTTRP